MNCSRKHCHSKDRSQRQCQRSSMIFPTDKSTEILFQWLLRLFLRSLWASNSPHCQSTVLMSCPCDSMSRCTFWNQEKRSINICCVEKHHSIHLLPDDMIVFDRYWYTDVSVAYRNLYEDCTKKTRLLYFQGIYRVTKIYVNKKVVKSKNFIKYIISSNLI